jgi:hypothetical protein
MAYRDKMMLGFSEFVCDKILQNGVIFIPIGRFAGIG